MKTRILAILEQSITVKKDYIEANADLLIAVVGKITRCLENGGKILFFGNGGSAADAQHLAAEFVGRFAFDRHPLAAIALTTDTSIITSIGNDYSFDDIFLRQVMALGKKDDIAFGISTSGNSPNVVRALEWAQKHDIATIGLAGGNGGQMAPLCDQLMAVTGPNTARIQETHILIGHILCAMTEEHLFPEQATK